MSKKTLIASLLAFLLTIGVVQQRSVVTAATELAKEALNEETPSAEETADFDVNDISTVDKLATTKKKRGNGFVRAIGAPFRALGRLFGGGGKKNDEQARRINNKEVEKFESNKVTRIKDANTPAATSNSKNVPTTATSIATFEKYLNKGRELLLEGDVNEAIRVLTGGVAQPPCYPATVLTDVPAEAEIAFEETFGPVAILEIVEDRDEAVRRSNASRFGLTAGILTGDTYRGLDLARRLEVGIVHINDQPVNDEPQMPFGGVKDSGWGRFGLGFAAEDFTELQWVTLRDEHARTRSEFWPYSQYRWAGMSRPTGGAWLLDAAEAELTVQGRVAALELQGEDQGLLGAGGVRRQADDEEVFAPLDHWGQTLGAGHGLHRGRARGRLDLRDEHALGGAGQLDAVLEGLAIGALHLHGGTGHRAGHLHGLGLREVVRRR